MEMYDDMWFVCMWFRQGSARSIQSEAYVVDCAVKVSFVLCVSEDWKQPLCLLFVVSNIHQNCMHPRCPRRTIIVGWWISQAYNTVIHNCESQRHNWKLRFIDHRVVQLRFAKHSHTAHISHAYNPPTVNQIAQSCVTKTLRTSFRHIASHRRYVNKAYYLRWIALTEAEKGEKGGSSAFPL